MATVHTARNVDNDRFRALHRKRLRVVLLGPLSSLQAFLFKAKRPRCDSSVFVDGDASADALVSGKAIVHFRIKVLVKRKEHARRLNVCTTTSETRAFGSKKFVFDITNQRQCPLGPVAVWSDQGEVNHQIRLLPRSAMMDPRGRKPQAIRWSLRIGPNGVGNFVLADLWRLRLRLPWRSSVPMSKRTTTQSQSFPATLTSFEAPDFDLSLSSAGSPLSFFASGVYIRLNLASSSERSGTLSWSESQSCLKRARTPSELRKDFNRLFAFAAPHLSVIFWRTDAARLYSVIVKTANRKFECADSFHFPFPEYQDDEVCPS